MDHARLPGNPGVYSVGAISLGDMSEDGRERHHISPEWVRISDAEMAEMEAELDEMQRRHIRLGTPYLFTGGIPETTMPKWSDAWMVPAVRLPRRLWKDCEREAGRSREDEDREFVYVDRRPARRARHQLTKLLGGQVRQVDQRQAGGL